MINKLTLADKSYYIFSLHKRENVTVTEDGVICLDDGDDDEGNDGEKVDVQRPTFQPLKIEALTSTEQPELTPPVVINDIAPFRTASKWPFDDDVFKRPNDPVEVYIPDEAVLQSQSLIHLSMKREEEELFDEDFLFNSDSEEDEESLPLREIDTEISDEEDCMIVGSFSQQLNIDGVYKKTIKTEIKDEVVSDDEVENIDDFFEEVALPGFESAESEAQIPPYIPCTQDIETRLASFMPDDGFEGVMEYDEEPGTENLAALLEDTIPLESTSPLNKTSPSSSLLSTSPLQDTSPLHKPLQPSVQETPPNPQQTSPLEPEKPHTSKDNSHQLKQPLLEQRHSTAEAEATNDIPCTPLTACITQLKAKMGVKRPPELIDAPPMPKRGRGRSKSMYKLSIKS
jgi:hypothetical protein